MRAAVENEAVVQQDAENEAVGEWGVVAGGVVVDGVVVDGAAG
jgi:hypothetical protein